MGTLASFAALSGTTARPPSAPPTATTRGQPSAGRGGQGGTVSTAVAALQAHVPHALASNCTTLAPTNATTGLVAAIGCRPGGEPGSVQYYQYADPADMNTAFETYAGGASQNGTCNDQAGARGTYQDNATGAALGSWACYYDTFNRSEMIWTNTNLSILAMAISRSDTPQQLHDWFFSSADPGPD